MVVITVVNEEFDAAYAEFGICAEVAGTGCFAAAGADGEIYSLLLTQTRDRSNMPCLESIADVLEDWRPEAIVLVGIAGGITRIDEAGELEGPRPGDVVCAEYIHYAEYTKRVDGRRLMRYFPLAHPHTESLRRHVKPIRLLHWADNLPVGRPGEGAPQVHFGELVAVEFLAGDGGSEQQIEVFSQFDHALAVDMESGGAARALHNVTADVHYGPVWFCVRGISDRAAASAAAQAQMENGNDDERVVWRPYAAAVAARFARHLVERLLADPRAPQEGDPGAPPWLHRAGAPT